MDHTFYKFIWDSACVNTGDFLSMSWKVVNTCRYYKYIFTVLVLIGFISVSWTVLELIPVDFGFSWTSFVLICFIILSWKVLALIPACFMSMSWKVFTSIPVEFGLSWTVLALKFVGFIISP